MSVVVFVDCPVTSGGSAQALRRPLMTHRSAHVLSLDTETPHRAAAPFCRCPESRPR